MRKKRILFIIEEDSKHGAAKSAKQLIKNLLEKNEVEIIVLAPLRYDDRDYFNSMGCRIIRLPFTYFLLSKPKNIYKRIIKKIVYGILHNVGNVLTLILLRFKVKKKDIDIIHCNSSRLDIGAVINSYYNKPLIWHLREFGEMDFDRMSAKRNYIEYMNKKGTLFIAVSDSVRKHWISKGISSNKIVKIFNGVEEPQNVVCNKKECDLFTVVMVGTLIDAKCQDQLIKALKYLNDKSIRVDLWGDGIDEYILYLHELVKKYDLTDSVRFCGYDNDVIRRLNSYDCGVICSKSEGFGRATAEYMMAGLPVIASDTGANLELINDGETGLIYKWGNTKDLASKIEYVRQNRDVSNKIGTKAMEFARSNFSQSVLANNIWNVYNRYL